MTVNNKYFQMISFKKLYCVQNSAYSHAISLIRVSALLLIERDGELQLAAEGLGLGSDGELCLDLVRLVLPGQMVCQAEELGKQREPWPCPTPMEGPSPLPPTGAWPEESA